MGCLDLIKGNKSLEEHFKDIDKLPIEEQRTVALQKIKEYHALLHNELEQFKKSINPKYKPTKFVAEDNTEKINEVKYKYQALIDATTKKPEISDLDYAKQEIEKGVTLWDGNPYSPRVDLGISRADIRKGEADILIGKENSVPAKRLIEAINKAKEKGGYDFIEGSGGNINKIFVPLSQEIIDNTQLIEEENNILNTEKESLANEYDAWFNALDESQQNEIREDYESTNESNESKVLGEDAQRGKSQENVVDKKTTEPKTKAERVKLANAKIDDIANAIKGIDEIFGIKIKIDDVNGVSKNGIDMVDVIASVVKKAVEAGINIDVAIQKTIEHFKKTIDFEIDPNDVKAKLEPTKEEVKKPTKKAASLNDKIKDFPKSNEFGKYLSGETIKRVEGTELRNDQTIETLILTDAGNYGMEVIELAKELYGDKYVEKTLEYLDNSNLKAHEKALIYVSLENEMHRRITQDPNNVGKQKLQDLVRKKSQKHLRESSLAINAGRLREMMKNGYITESVTDKMFSSEQLEDKGKVQKAIESNMDEINNEAESLENDIDFDIPEPKIKRSKTVVKKEISETLKKLRADLLRAAKGDVALSSIPYAAQLKVATPHIIKLSKLLTELGGMKTREIIDEIHSQIKDVFENVNKDDIENILRESNKPKTRTKTDAKVTQAKNLVKQALIDKGFSREITVTVNDKDAYGNIIKDKKGNNKKVKEKRIVLDWKKLAGEAGSIENIRENVQEVLKDKGYTDAEIQSMSKYLENEYDNLRASIIEKSLKELERRNTIRKKYDIKSSAKKLAELYNYGLFEKEKDTYNNLINSALGFNELDNKSFKELEKLAKSLADLYNQDVSEIGLQTSISYINKEIARTLNNAAFLQSNTAFKLASIVQEYMNLSTRFLLHSLGQIIENPFSGYSQRVYSKIAYLRDKTDNKALSDQRRKISKERFKSIVRDGGSAYGDTSSLLINDSKIENWLNSGTDSEINHSLISFYMGRAFLEGFDSRHKTVLTEKYFVNNLIRVLSHPSNPSKMSKEEALNFVTEKLTGESFEKAKVKAKEVTEKINDGAGRKILSTKERAINIFAQDIMKDSLLEGKMLNEQQLEASFNAAYKAAGRDIGHVANNPASEMVGSLNSKTEISLQEAIKEKDWNRAAYFTLKQIFTRNIMNTFVGGGSNWIVLGLEKSGIYGLPMLAINTLAKSNKKLDLTTVEGVKNLEKVLYNDMSYKNSAARVVIGTGIAVIMASMAISTGADDDINEWLKKNVWAKKYFDKLAPEVLIAILAYKNEDMGKYFKHVFNAKSEFFDLNQSAARSVTELFSDKETKGGELGKFIGSKLNFPAPTKSVSDIKNIYKWATDQEVKKTNYKASGFWNGFFQGGLVEKVGLRPGGEPEKEAKKEKTVDEKIEAKMKSLDKKMKELSEK